jgi:hypothetical protein
LALGEPVGLVAMTRNCGPASQNGKHYNDTLHMARLIVELLNFDADREFKTG